MKENDWKKWLKISSWLEKMLMIAFMAITALLALLYAPQFWWMTLLAALTLGCIIWRSVCERQCREYQTW